MRKVLDAFATVAARQKARQYYWRSEMFDRITPEWFEEWFTRKFSPDAEPYAPLYVAERLCVDKNVVYRALLCGDLEGIKPSPGRWVIPREALRRWLLERYSLNLPDD